VPSDAEPTVLVLEILHNATHSHPVNVNIRNRHKDRYLHHLALDILIIRDNLRNNDTAITRREEQLIIVNLHSPWLTEEGRNEEPEDEQKYRHKPHNGDMRVDEEVDKRPDR
jgi:hypothetical protein